MAYHPVQPTIRTCSHCGQSFEAKDRRRIYCSSSCNTLAWMDRQDKHLTEHKKSLKGELTFSLQNTAVVAAGSATVAAANYLLNDAPFYKALTEHFNKIEHRLGYQAGREDAMYKNISDFMKAVRMVLPEVDQQIRIMEASRISLPKSHK